MRNAHFSFMAGTAVALVLTAVTTASTSPFNQDSSYVAPSASRTQEQFGRSSTEGTTRNAMPTQRQQRPEARDYEPRTQATTPQNQNSQSRNTRGPDSRPQDSRVQDVRSQDSRSQNVRTQDQRAQD